jgi:hypothetical protein
MRKVFLGMVAVAGMACALGAFKLGLDSTTYYHRAGVVSEVNQNEISIDDDDGNVWVWELENGDYFSVGDKVDLTMDTNETSTIYDDIIKKVVIER